MKARIYKPSKNAMQSGLAGSAEWVLEFEPETARRAEPLMGWISGQDTKRQLKLKFASLDEAEFYAKKNGISYQVQQEKNRKRAVVSYSDNFKANRIEPWTH